MIGNYDGSGLEPLTKAEIPKIGRIYDKLGHALIILNEDLEIDHFNNWGLKSRWPETYAKQ